MASAVIEESGHQRLFVRPPNGDFVKVIKATFEKAVEGAPSIILWMIWTSLLTTMNVIPMLKNMLPFNLVLMRLKVKEYLSWQRSIIALLPRSLHRGTDKLSKLILPRGKDALAIIAHC